MNALGRVHGGAVSTLIHTAVGLGAFLTLPSSAKGFSVLDTHVNYIATPQVGIRLTTDARVIHQGKSTQVWQADVRQEGTGRLVAHATATALNTYENEGKHREGEDATLE